MTEATVRWTSYKLGAWELSVFQNNFASPKTFAHLFFGFFLLLLKAEQGKMPLFTECKYTQDHYAFQSMFVLENRQLGAWDQNSTCSHRRWFRVKRAPDVCVVRPAHGSHVGAGTERSPSSLAPGGCPCGRVEGRRLDQAYLCELACHLWHVLFTELKRWGYQCSFIIYFLKMPT